MRMSVMGQGRARVGCCSVAGTDCSAPAAILDAFLRLDKKGIVKPGESKKGLEMGILGPVHHSKEISGIDRGARPCRHRPASLNPTNEAARGGWVAAGTTRTSMGSQK